MVRTSFHERSDAMLDGQTMSGEDFAVIAGSLGKTWRRFRRRVWPCGIRRQFLDLLFAMQVLLQPSAAVSAVAAAIAAATTADAPGGAADTDAIAADAMAGVSLGSTSTVPLTNTDNSVATGVGNDVGEVQGWGSATCPCSCCSC